jgi:hypothetical protein
MPGIFRFMLINFATGAALGWAFAGVLFWYDAFGLSGLILHSPDRWLIAAMLLVSVGGTFGVCFTATRLEFLGSGDLGRAPAIEARPRAVKVVARGAAPRPSGHTKN